MTNTRFRFTRVALAAAATTALTAGAVATSAPAQAGGSHGDHGDHHGYDVVIPLTEHTTDELTDGANGVKAIGKADSWKDDGQIALSFPVKGSDDRHARHGDDHAVALLGGIAFTGAGADVSWTDLVVRNGVVSAVLSGGDRAPVLTFAGDRGDDHHRAARHGDHGATLVLTPAGAASLNRAAQGAPFDAGDTFAGGDCS